MRKQGTQPGKGFVRSGGFVQLGGKTGQDRVTDGQLELLGLRRVVVRQNVQPQQFARMVGFQQPLFLRSIFIRPCGRGKQNGQQKEARQGPTKLTQFDPSPARECPGKKRRIQENV